MKKNSKIYFHSTAAFVADINKAKQFYHDILNQKIEMDFGKNVIFKCGISLWKINMAHNNLNIPV